MQTRSAATKQRSDTSSSSSSSKSPPTARSLTAVPNVRLSTADFAKSLFLQSHPDVLKASGIADPFFQCLKPILGGTHDAHVSLSADAVALAALGQSSDRSDILAAAAAKYGRAIQATQQALFRPHQASSDATLSAVKLLMAYEFITADALGTSSWLQHVFGQLAITLQRGAYFARRD